MSREREVLEYVAKSLGVELNKITVLTPLGGKAPQIVEGLGKEFNIQFEETPTKVGHILRKLGI